jgi:molybdopterin converting factor small subunit
LRIRLYGRLADAIGPEVELDVAGASVGAIRDRLAAEHPAAAESLARSRALIGSAVVRDDHAATDDLEFLPPVSGG